MACTTADQGLVGLLRRVYAARPKGSTVCLLVAQWDEDFLVYLSLGITLAAKNSRLSSTCSWGDSPWLSQMKNSLKWSACWRVSRWRVMVSGSPMAPAGKSTDRARDEV